ncbi:hypothetical protein [Nannocystis pusilla]|uniref:hypothetical protein n=1 Tax=Nannocystis pusilla TaxID=889268 RepID=UPI003DA44C65
MQAHQRDQAGELDARTDARGDAREHCRGSHRRQLGLDLGGLGGLAPARGRLHAEHAVGDEQDEGADADPQQAVQQQRAVHRQEQAVLLGDGPVAVDQVGGVEAERVEQRGQLLLLDVADEAVGDGVADEEDDALDVDGDEAAGQHADGEEQGADEQPGRDDVDEHRPDVGAGRGDADLVGVDPRHVRADPQAERAAGEHQDGDDVGAEEAAEHERRLAQARGEQQLVGLVLEVAQHRGAGDRRGEDGAHQGEHHDGGAHQPRRVVQHLAAGAAEADDLGRHGEEAEQRQREREHVGDRPPQVVAHLEGGEGEELVHAASEAAPWAAPVM